MPHAVFITPRAPRRAPLRRNALLCALGLAILSGLALSGAQHDGAQSRQGFSKTNQSPSFVPETVRLRTPE